MRKRQEIKSVKCSFISPSTDEQRLNLLTVLYGFHDTKDMIYALAARAKANKAEPVTSGESN